jgi:hypothetical protein
MKIGQSSAERVKGVTGTGTMNLAEDLEETKGESVRDLFGTGTNVPMAYERLVCPLGVSGVNETLETVF